MPTDWLEALPKLVSIVEKGGIIGLLIIVVVALIWVILRYRKDLIEAYQQRDDAWHERDTCRMIRFRYKAELDRAGLKVDISDIMEEMRDDKR